MSLPRPNTPHHQALNDDELEELSALLEGFENAVELEALDGLFCALIIGPVLVPPSEWLPAVLGTEEPGWDNEKAAHHMIGLLMRHWNTVALGLREDWAGISAEEGAELMYFPLLDDPGASGHPLAEGWARGFRDGLSWLDDAHWDALEADEECVALLSLIAALDTGEKSKGHPLSDSERDEILAPLAAGLQYLYTFWRRRSAGATGPRPPIRAQAQAGRNDPCPCGSGQKYKKCCGAPEKLH